MNPAEPIEKALRKEMRVCAGVPMSGAEAEDATRIALEALAGAGFSLARTADAAVAVAALIAAALAAHPWASYPRSAHQDHGFDSGCGVCRCDVEAMGNVASYALDVAGLVVVSAEDLRVYVTEEMPDFVTYVTAQARLRAALPERKRP